MDKAAELEILRKKMISDDLPLKGTSKNLVFGEGRPDARVMLIGEAPGRNEDETGRPFAGRAGLILDELLHEAGLARREIFITSIIKYRPPNNRIPSGKEIRMHGPFLETQVRIIRPEILVTLGNLSTRYVLAGFNLARMKSIEGITSLHGKPHKILLDDKKLTVLPVYHPAAALYSPGLLDSMKNDYRELKSFLT